MMFSKFICYPIAEVDECAGVNNCAQKCIDGRGTYTCACNTGYNLNDTDKVSCMRMYFNNRDQWIVIFIINWVY